MLDLSTHLTAAELEQRLRAVDPGVVLVAGRILRRVVKKHRGVGGPILQVPHRKTYLLSEAELFAIASRKELGLATGRRLPHAVVLLQLPDSDWLFTSSSEEVLRKYWRWLFHARIHAVLQERRLDEHAVRERIRRLGLTEFAQARNVLKQEHFLLPPEDDATTYEEFAALYLELRFFAPERLPWYFPGLDGAAVEQVFAEDIDAPALLAATQPEGVSNPLAPIPPLTKAFIGSVARDAAQAPALLLQADQAELKGNQVRAALLRLRAGAKAEAAHTIGRLVERLQAALELTVEDAAIWQHALTALLPAAASSLWPVEARLLFDLQNICIDRERAIYAADLVEWVVSLGKKPVKRLLPYQGDVLAVKHLRVALRRLISVRLEDVTRQELELQLTHALHHAQEQLRERLRPVVLRTLDGVDMRPASTAETVARAKMVEELLDLVCVRGFLNLSDVRDGIARNRLKMPDLNGPVEFVRGDRLLRANRRLSESIDGVYRRGEIYLRALQRLNSVAFGTRVGRFLTRYFVLPFGCAFVLLEGVQHLLIGLLRLVGVIKFGHIPAVASAVGLSAVAIHGPRLRLTNVWSVAVLGLFIIVMLYLPRFRGGVLRLLHLLYRGGHALLFEVPAMLWRVPFIRAFFESRLYLLAYHFIVKPLVYAVPAALILYLWNCRPPVVALGGAAMFAAMSLLFNSTAGQQLEEFATDGLVRGWHLLAVDVLPGLFRWIVYVFKQFLEGVERVIYTVDEWLRFREGDRAASFYFKVGLGLLWFCITYIVRFAVNLLIEPQLNPIKHFPVVTVSHKLVVTLLVPPMALALEHALRLERAEALTVAFAIGTGIPGIFGFLVWELKENWKMYRANQPPALEVAGVGAHGETMLGLLRPGIHSGTLPKLYAKLRRAHGKALHKHTEALEHVAESIRHFVERTLLATLSGSSRWGLADLTRVASVQCGCNRIRLELSCIALQGETLLLDVEEHAGWLSAGLTRPGWLASLSAEQTAAFHAALPGFYKLAGIDLIREQIAALLPPEALFTMTAQGLTVWLGDAEVLYDLSQPRCMHPQLVRGILPIALPVLTCKDVVFSETPLLWRDWVATWERERGEKEAVAAPLTEVCV